MNSTGIRLCIVLLSIICVCQSLAHAVADSRARQADAILSSFNSRHAPGVAVLVLQDGQVAYEQGFGVTDLRRPHPIGEHTNFRLASVTKQFTAMAIMLLVHDGKLNYDEHLTDIFPDFPAYGRNITIRNLLNHTSGLQDYEDLMAPQPASASDKQISDTEVLDLLKHQTTTKFQPGTHWQYSNSGYVVLGLIVEKASHQPFRDFLHGHIFAPLHMDHTILYEKGKNEVTNRAYGHTKVGPAWQQTDQSPTSATQGDGGVYSSLTDLAKWDAALRKYTLLSAADFRPAVTPVDVPGVEEPDGKPAQYGFGWFLNPYKDQVRMWHYGETIGFRTAIERFTANKLTIIVLANRADVDANGLALKLADIYLPEK